MSAVLDMARAITGRKKDHEHRPEEVREDIPVASSVEAEHNFALDDPSDRSGLTILEKRAFEYMDEKLRELTEDAPASKTGSP